MLRIATERTTLLPPSETTPDELSPEPAGSPPWKPDTPPAEFAIFVGNELPALLRELVKRFTASTSDDHVLNFDSADAAEDLFQKHERKVPTGAEPMIIIEKRDEPGMRSNRVAESGQMLSREQFVRICLYHLGTLVERKMKTTTKISIQDLAQD